MHLFLQGKFWQGVSPGQLGREFFIYAFLRISEQNKIQKNYEKIALYILFFSKNKVEFSLGLVLSNCFQVVNIFNCYLNTFYTVHGKLELD